MSGAELYDRIVTVIAGPPGGEGQLFEGLRISFDTVHSAGRHPNGARITIYNISPDNLALFKPRKNIVQLNVGYGGVPRTLFLGNPVRDGLRYGLNSSADRELQVELADGGAGYAGARVVRTFSGNTPVSSIVDAVQQTTGWALGDIDLPAGLTLPGSTTVIDKAPDILDRVAQMIPGGGRWFVRDNALYIKGLTKPTAEAAILLSQTERTLIGTPTPTRKGVQARGLLDATMRPGRRFRVEHELVSGNYYATEVRCSGDAWGGPFYMDLTGKALGVD